MKSDAWDGGHRVPYGVRWPGVIAPGRVSVELIGHNHLMAACAERIGVTLREDAGVDCFSILQVLLIRICSQAAGLVYEWMRDGNLRTAVVAPRPTNVSPPAAEQPLAFAF